MKYCETLAALLDPFIDGELSPGEMARVRAHLDECPACRAYVDDALAIRAAFPDVEDTELPDGFAEAVMARIQAEAAPQKKTSRPWLKALASLAACCAIVLLVGPLFSGGAKTEAPAAAADTAASTERAMVSSEEATEEAAPAEAPAAATYYTAGTAETETAAPAPASAAAPEEDQASFKANSPSVQMQAADGGSISTLTLPPEAASLLADFTPAEETDTQARYELSRQDCDALTESLSQAGIGYELEDAGSDTVLVILEK